MDLSKFKIRKLEYAYTSKGVSHISIANKFNEYFLDRDMTIPLVFCSGDKNVNYWRRKSNISRSDMIKVFGNSESIEHYNKKMEIANSLTFFDDELNIKYKAHSAEVEYRLLAINKIVDVAFFDDDGNILICIEVFKTNKKNYSDIDKFNEENIIVYEYDLQKEKSYPISAGVSICEINKRIRRGDKIVQKILKRIKMLKKGYQRVDGKRKDKWRKYYKEVRAIERRVSEIRKYEEERRDRIKEGVYNKFRERFRDVYEKISREDKTIQKLHERSDKAGEAIKELRYRISRIKGQDIRIREIREEIVRIENEV